LREIALARVEGYTVQEIAERLEISKRSVERKLDLIRQAWAKEWDHGSAG
jgi:DNA-directed RNA polymerase specialized sigma24 family protein